MKDGSKIAEVTKTGSGGLSTTVEYRLRQQLWRYGDCFQTHMRKNQWLITQSRRKTVLICIQAYVTKTT